MSQSQAGQAPGLLNLEKNLEWLAALDVERAWKLIQEVAGGRRASTFNPDAALGLALRLTCVFNMTSMQPVQPPKEIQLGPWQPWTVAVIRLVREFPGPYSVQPLSKLSLITGQPLHRMRNGSVFTLYHCPLSNRRPRTYGLLYEGQPLTAIAVQVADGVLAF